MRAFLAGVLTVIVVVAIAGLVMVKLGYVPAAADAPKASGLEKWAANTSLNATIDREQPQPPYPFGPVTDATIVAGAKLYMTNCSVCHGSAGSDESNVAKGLYIPAPQFTKHGVDDDPEGETYWKIEHGIRFTGMPSFKDSLTEEQIWQITYFLKKDLKALPTGADIIWHQPHGD
jgi:mono/diheme cytochrome c family protein